MLDFPKLIGSMWLIGFIICVMQGPKDPPRTPQAVQLELPLDPPSKRGFKRGVTYPTYPCGAWVRPRSEASNTRGLNKGVTG